MVISLFLVALWQAQIMHTRNTWFLLGSNSTYGLCLGIGPGHYKQYRDWRTGTVPVSLSVTFIHTFRIKLESIQRVDIWAPLGWQPGSHVPYVSRTDGADGSQSKQQEGNRLNVCMNTKLDTITDRTPAQDAHELEWKVSFNCISKF